VVAPCRSAERPGRLIAAIAAFLVLIVACSHDAGALAADRADVVEIMEAWMERLFPNEEYRTTFDQIRCEPTDRMRANVFVEFRLGDAVHPSEIIDGIEAGIALEAVEVTRDDASDSSDLDAILDGRHFWARIYPDGEASMAMSTECH